MSSNLDAAEQVIYLRDQKDVSFRHMGEDEAVQFLAEKNYFFKLKAFAKNYEKRFKEDDRKGRYIGLDFAYLVELSRIDKHLSDLVLHLTLDIEHYLKVRINRAAMTAKCDPAKLAERYLDFSRANAVKDQVSKVDTDKALASFEGMRLILEGVDGDITPEGAVSAVNELKNLLEKVTNGSDPDHVRNSYIATGKSPYSMGIVEKYGVNDMPYWCLMELMSFGPIIGFYNACFRKGGFLDDVEERETLKLVKNLLRRVQTLRNAAAHGDCLLNGLSNYSRSASAKGVKKMLQTREGIAGEVVDRIFGVSVAADLTAVLMCYDIMVPTGSARRASAREVEIFSQRITRNESWFTKNYSIRSFIDYVTLVFPYFADKFDKM